MSKQTRQLKVYSKAFLHATLYHRRYVLVPQIILQGQWLQEIGFLKGGTVDVAFEEGRIVVTPAATPQ
ncbi:type I addiction module toxin, SymE family [Emticicia sp. CRIBPO]|uniref:SymE family type I addiction module toxin n=1 Tax=Emticicia sp. CRIBPO TaxID=2683258 RepID=UPI0014132B16|nr:SymE family type I addiction module toxin [Emticicia sp. CRIBPO]NBA88910.1 type I addiction module toxin, SymE family [Emticicia sp. CRIBPO]